MNFPKIYLASKSPRRRELLSQIGVEFSVLSVDVDESRLTNEAPTAYVKRVAIAKAKAGWDSLTTQNKQAVLGSDTSVVLGNTILGKPKNNADAKHMLQQLSGCSHQVMTAVAIVNETGIVCEQSVSQVSFAELTDVEIEWYLSTKEGEDKAGGYAVQGLAAIFIKQIQGSYSGIMGLPIRETALLLTKLSTQ
jgi:septum formation protein